MRNPNGLHKIYVSLVPLGHPKGFRILKEEDLVSSNCVEIVKLNIAYGPLMSSQRLILPPLNIKLGFMNNFMKALMNRSGILYLWSEFPTPSEANLREGIFVRLNARKLNRLERRTWKPFKAVMTNFLHSQKSDDYEALVNKLQKVGETKIPHEIEDPLPSMVT